MQWDQFLDDCKQKIEQLEKQLKETEETYGAKLEKMPALIMQAVNTGGNLPMQEPLFATKAGLVLKEREKFYEIKLKEFGNKTQANLNDLNKIEKARKRCVPEAPCTCFLNADNDYIRSYNERKQESDEEALTFFKNFSNDLAYWSQYSSTDEIQYKIIALGFTIDWLKKLTEYIPLFADREYDCSDEEKAKPYKLPEWDFTANCKYNVDINFFIVKQQINCSHSSTTYDLGPVKYTERELGTKYIGGTLILSPKASVGGEAGPLTVEAFIGADITIDLDENKDIKDWDSKVTVGMETGIGISKGPVKFGASVTNAIELEIDGSGLKDVILVTAVKAEAGIEAPKSDGKTTMDEHINEGVGLINKGIGELQTSVKIGMEDRVSLISGHGSESNIGLGGVTISL